jgi:hypothetical protein
MAAGLAHGSDHRRDVLIGMAVRPEDNLPVWDGTVPCAARLPSTVGREQTAVNPQRLAAVPLGTSALRDRHRLGLALGLSHVPAQPGFDRLDRKSP